MKINHSSNIAFQGVNAGTIKPQSFLSKVANYDTLNHKARNIGFPVYAAMILFLVTGTRYIQARDKDEKREILTRDVISLLTYLYATPLMMKGISSVIEKKTGFLTQFKKNVDTLNDPEKTKPISRWKKVKGYILPHGGHQLLDNGNIKDTYVLGDKKLSDFAKFITANTSEDGPQLHKMIFFALEKDKSKLTATDTTNAGMLKWIEGLEKAGSPILEKLKGSFKEGGIVQKKVEVLKAVPELFALVSTIAIAGWILPWFNIQYTRALYKSGKNKPATPQPIQQAQNVQPEIVKDSQRKLFSEFVK